MTSPYFEASTLDDLMRKALDYIFEAGKAIEPTKGRASEITGVMLELSNPRARLSRTETRGKPFSCLGELCWYLSGSNAVEFISYYIGEYRKFAEDGSLYGGYGPRLFGTGFNTNNQVDNVIDLLKRKPSSRQAVIQLFDSNDILTYHKDVPCTCTLQFLIREKKLHLITYMRSNDIFLGLPHDIFSFTMLQEIVARTLDVKLGTYKHIVGSLHLYDLHEEQAKNYCNEGWQTTQFSMPPMPSGNPFPEIGRFLKAEQVLREGGDITSDNFESLNYYWIDLIRLLQIFRYSKGSQTKEIEKIREEMTTNIYDSYIEKRLD